MLYTVEKISGLERPWIARMSFELPYLDWCRFERSEIFQSLINYLEELEKQDIPKMQKESEDL